MRKPILLFCALLLSLGTWATPQAVNVYLLDGTVTSTVFDDFQNLELSGDDIIIHKHSSEPITIAMDNIVNIILESHSSGSTTNLELITDGSLRIYHDAHNGIIRSDNAVLKYAVFDTLGRFICSGTPAEGTCEVIFPLQSAATSIYLVYVETTAGKATAKIIL